MFKYCVFLLIYCHLKLVKSQVGLGGIANTIFTPLQPLNIDTVEDVLDTLPPSITEKLSPILKVIENTGIAATYNIKTTEFPTRQVYDFIVIGAGPAGATVANRLSENPDWNILLLEAGGEETLLHQIPATTAFTHQTKSNYGYRIEPQENACYGMTDQLCTWPRGKVLGGTSSIHAMIHTRGNKRDYDNWADLGNDGWSYEKVLPYFIKSEKFNVKKVEIKLTILCSEMPIQQITAYHVRLSPVDLEYHGTDGYLCVEDIPYHTSLAKAYIEAGQEVGYDFIDNNGAQQIGFSYLQVQMDQGARCSAGRAHLRHHRSNLDIVPSAFVTKILINDHKRAYGVEYVKNGQIRTVRASKEVISSAGTVNGAQLLMLSGIGPKEHLEELGIDVIKDAKVGYNMYEHVGTWGLVFTTNATDAITLNTAINPVNVLSYALKREGPLTLPGGGEIISFIRTKYATNERPDLEILFFSGGFSSDNGLAVKPSYGISDEVYDQYWKPLEFKSTWTACPIVQYPKSVGRLTLNSKDPFEAPILDPNLLSDPYDLEIILEGIKIAINISQTEALQKYDSQVYDKSILGCESYEFGSDDYYRCLIKTVTLMENHEMGTAKMGNSSDPDAVVDPQLRVYGIRGLRVIDASVIPKPLAGHISATVYMIGEKGADMIKKTYQEDCKATVQN